MALAATRWRWSAEERALRPLTNRDLGLDDGRIYLMDAIEERSAKSHAHFFARVTELWQNLPEQLLDRPWSADPNQMRDHALLSTGWRTSEVYQCATRAEALRWRNMLPPLIRAEGQKARHVYTVSVAEGSTLVRWVPRSQAYRAMAREDFQKSKDDCLAFLSDLIGVPA